jgi:hypothetical protein
MLSVWLRWYHGRWKMKSREVFLFHTGDWTQDLILVGQVSTTWPTPPPPFPLVIFWDEVSHYAQPAILLLTFHHIARMTGTSHYTKPLVEMEPYELFPQVGLELQSSESPPPKLGLWERVTTSGETTWFSDGFDVSCERKRSIKDSSRVLMLDTGFLEKLLKCIEYYGRGNFGMWKIMRSDPDVLNMWFFMTPSEIIF